MAWNFLNALLLASVIGMASLGAAHAGTDDRSPVRATGGEIVRSSNANCVRTNSLADQDACKPASVMRTERVVQQTKKVQHKAEPPKTNELSKDEKTVYFDFNGSALTPSAKERLNTLASSLKADQSVKEAMIVGSADRIGTNGYNEQLSQKRAEAVRDYLIENGYTKARVTETRWVGEEKPLTNCAATQKRTQLIACLQNDRRVEVEMVYLTNQQHVDGQ